MPYPWTARAIRSTTNCSAIWANPEPSAPTRLATGTRHDANPSSAVSEQCQPIFGRARSTVNPAVPFSTTSSEMPAAPGPPVRTATVTKSARSPLVMKVLVPSTTYASPSRRAVVRMAATSEPPSGSVIARAPIFSPASVGRTNLSTSAGPPDAAMCGSAIPPVNSAAINPLDAPASNIASCTAIVSSRSPPSPPTDSGNETPSSPCLAAARCRDRGTSPASSQSWRCGATSRRTNSRADSRNAVTALLIGGARGSPRAAPAPTRRGPWPAGRTASRRPRPAPATRARRR